ncbi:MAG TPA: AAA family ATPase, partial [Polyangiaceae bacterium]|nr:AAA family ATPase [Polyangiaceae bacterium]
MTLSVQEYRFGPFRLDVHTRMLWSGGVPVALAPKAAELLLALVQEGERGLTKAQLLDRLWPDTVVAENNLTVTMSALRKALGETATQPRYVHTLSRRGYRFVSQPPCDAAAEGVHALATASAAPVVAPANSRARLQPIEPAGPQGSAPFAPFVGRQRELGHLEQRYQQALGGHGRVVFISGKPGIGKTTLAQEFLRRCGSAGEVALVARGRCLESFGSGEAYLPFLEALDSLLHGPESARVQRVVRAFAPTWCGQFPVLASGQAEEAEQRREAAGATRERMLREWVEAFGALSRERPLLVLLEDLHWADPSSIDLLRLLCQRSSGHAWLVLGTLRAAEATLQNPPLAKLLLELGARECDELQLEPLTEPQLGGYLEQRLGANQ